MFNAFPKTRPVLPPDYHAILRRHCMENRKGASPSSSLTQRMEAWMHAQVAADARGRAEDISTLEIGAGTLNHLDYEKNVRTLDIVEPGDDFLDAFPQRRARVRHCYRDIFQIPGERRYERIISIATFEHLTDLPMVVAKAGLLLADGGSLRVAIPGEGGLLWTLGYRLTNGIEFRCRYGLDYERIMRYEHVNTADEIEAVLKYFFARVSWRVFGLNRMFSFYRFYECHALDRGRCAAFLKERGVIQG